MPRLAAFVVARLLADLGILAAWAGVLTLIAFYIIIGPFACIWTGARLGVWFDVGLFWTDAAMLGGVWLYGSVRPRLYRYVFRAKRWAIRQATMLESFRDDLWRQYRNVPP